MSDEAHVPSAHVPVMLSEIMRLLDPRPGEVVLDATVGCGGHAGAIAGALAGTGLLLGMDRDPAMAERARARLGAAFAHGVKVVVANFSEADVQLKSVAGRLADGVLLDLGAASPQIDDPGRGFSYRADGPLDMRMAQFEGPSAEEWINRVPEGELARVLFEFGEERFSRRIAKAIVRARARSRIRRTGDLAEIIRSAVPAGRRRLHPARRSFQAIRIVINDEMRHLERFLEILPGMLNPGGRCVVISYHSLEDRRVKNAFRAGAREGTYELLTRKPLRPSEREVCANPRSRSARVRAVRRAGGGSGT